MTTDPTPGERARTPSAGVPGGIAGYVVTRGLVPPGTPLTVTELVGGVSGEVVLVTGGERALVVKRALARLAVAAMWTAKPERALTEAAALEVLHRLTPDNTPELVDVDTDTLTLTMTAAPASWPTWKSVLLDDASPDRGAVLGTARVLGTVLGTWHGRTWHDAALAGRFDDYEAFEQLRLSPFHAATAERHPDLRGALLDCAAELRERRDCLVHGDFSPKNVLVGEGTWVLDFEVAHVGASVFDLAFMQTHLVLKALHLPDRAPLLADAAAALGRAYLDAAGRAELPARLELHTACLLLARLDGVSPAGYLDAGSGARVRSVATDLLRAPDRSEGRLWERVLDLAGAHA